MLKAICELESMTPFLFNRHISTEIFPLLPNETKDDWEKRNWRERIEYNGTGNAILAGVRFKNALVTGAQWMNIQIPGQGKATYSKHFRGGLIVMNKIVLRETKDEVEPLRLYTSPRPKDGKRWIHFPVIPEWKGTLEINILDEKITEEVFTKVLTYSGLAVGIGAMRPENGNDNGRYEVMGEILFERK